MATPLAAPPRSWGALAPAEVSYFYPQILSVKHKFDRAVVRYDAWFLVFIAVLLAIGATLLAGMAAWCVVNQHGRFSGEWKWVNYGISVNMECVR